MRSKATTYLLIIIVAVVWGVILKKIFFSSPKPADVIAAVERPAEPDNEEPCELLLDYPDPFLRGNKPERPVESPREEAAPAPPKPVKEKIVPAIRYYGRLRAENGQTHCLVEIDRHQYTLREGETEGGYKLLKIFPDSLRFSREREIYVVNIMQ